MVAVMLLSGLLALVATLSWNFGWFKWLLPAEVVLAAGLYLLMRASVGAARWTSPE